MAKLTRYLLIGIFVLALAAAAFSFLLFQRRAEFRKRADELASTVAKMVKALDNESQTNVAGSVNFKPEDPETKTPESGTLSMKSFHESPDNFKSALSKAESLASEIADQKNFFAERLAEVGVALGAPPEAASPDSLKSAADKDQYSKLAKLIAGWAQATAKRDKLMQQAVVKIARDIQQPIDPQVLARRTQKTDQDGNKVYGDFPCAEPLAMVEKAVTDLNTRCRDYGDTLAKAIKEIPKYDWTATPQQILDKNNYSEGLTRMMNDFQGVNEKLVLLETTQKELNDTKIQLQAKTDQINDLQKERDNLRDSLAKANVTIQRLKEIIGITDKGGINGVSEVNPNVEGKVLEYNKDWNYVIINLGRNKIRENLPMVIARGNHFIAKIRISKVLGKISVGEILPDPRMTRPVKKNDRVILSADMVQSASSASSEKGKNHAE